MSIKKVSKTQPKLFEFTKENLAKVKNEKKKYPNERMSSAVMSLLYLAQNQNDNWIPLSAIKYIAKMLNMPYIKVYEVATFYSMFNLSPVGKYFVQVCTTTPCMIRGAKKITELCKKLISQKENNLSENQKCSWVEVECLGACTNAPMMQINQDYFENLDVNKTEKIIYGLLKDEFPEPDGNNSKKSHTLKKTKTLQPGIKNA